MSSRKTRVHLASSKANFSLCSMPYVALEADVSRVTCKICLQRYAGQRAVRAPALTGDSGEIAQALIETLAPTAPPPPRVTPQVWATSCKGGEYRRCGECELCLWERDAQLWAAVEPWNKRHTLQRPEGAPRWSSATAALVALVEFERHDRSAPSALGGMLDRIKRGATGERTCARPDDPMLARAGELVRVRQALELAYPDGAHALPAETCRGVLLMRTPGVATAMPTYEALATRFGASVGTLQALVRNGRRVVEGDLVERGLIPVPRAPARRRPTGAPFYAEAAE